MKVEGVRESLSRTRFTHRSREGFQQGQTFLVYGARAPEFQCQARPIRRSRKNHEESHPVSIHLKELMDKHSPARENGGFERRARDACTVRAMPGTQGGTRRRGDEIRGMREHHHGAIPAHQARTRSAPPLLRPCHWSGVMPVGVGSTAEAVASVQPFGSRYTKPVAVSTASGPQSAESTRRVSAAGPAGAAGFDPHPAEEKRTLATPREVTKTNRMRGAMARMCNNADRDASLPGRNPRKKSRPLLTSRCSSPIFVHQF